MTITKASLPSDGTVYNQVWRQSRDDLVTEFYCCFRAAVEGCWCCTGDIYYAALFLPSALLVLAYHGGSSFLVHGPSTQDVHMSILKYVCCLRLYNLIENVTMCACSFGWGKTYAGKHYILWCRMRILWRRLKIYMYCMSIIIAYS